MVRLILRPNNDGKNCTGMWIPYNKGRYVLDALAIKNCGAMGSPVWAKPQYPGGYDHPPFPPRLLLYNERREFIGAADLE